LPGAAAHQPGVPGVGRDQAARHRRAVENAPWTCWSASRGR